MTILFLILLIPLLAATWYGIDYLVKQIMKEKYNAKNYAGFICCGITCFIYGIRLYFIGFGVYVGSRI